MELTAMRYRTFIWPHNPHTYRISFRRHVAEQKIPFGNYCVQDLGLGARVLEGEGEFAGEGAYDTFKELASLFYQGGPGLLVHPVWQTANAYFTELSLLQRPLPDYVAYRFAFTDARDVVQKGLNGLYANRTVVVYGCLNKALVFLAQIAPRFLVRMIAVKVLGSIQKR